MNNQITTTSGIILASGEIDETWIKAQLLSEKILKSTGGMNWKLVRSAWHSNSTPKELVRLLGFCRLDVEQLFNASEETQEKSSETLELCIENLGVKYSALILIANYTCMITSYGKPAEKFKNLLSDFITHIEIGHKFGERVSSVGSVTGALMGYACILADLVFMAENEGAYNQLKNLRIKDEIDEFEKKNFGCQRYQVTAFAMQNFGFGIKAALAAVMALGKIPPIFYELKDDDVAVNYRNAMLWIQALRYGRGYPAELEARNYFSEIATPSDPAAKNKVLEFLYTEVAKIRSKGSNWNWHIPSKRYLENTAARGKEKKSR